MGKRRLFVVTSGICEEDYSSDEEYSGDDLREALDTLSGTRTIEVDGVESIESDSTGLGAVRWITVTNSPEYRTGCQEYRELHLRGLSVSSSRRVARLAGVKL